ncbi:MAG: hypothetical protein EXQ70_09935 [Solirubrobacterales bacterium]|nr:hypothetical protein [Solirubrobacterales bacterium]
MPRLSSSQLAYLTEVDHHDHEALIALDEEDGAARLLAARALEEGISDFTALLLPGNDEMMELLGGVGSVEVTGRSAAAVEVLGRCGRRSPRRSVRCATSSARSRPARSSWRRRPAVAPAESRNSAAPTELWGRGRLVNDHSTEDMPGVRGSRSRCSQRASAWWSAPGPGGVGAGAEGAAAQKRPNIVVIMSDDQTVESMGAMPKLGAKLADRGVTFNNNLVSFPLCCPSRATFLTGQYSDNNGVRGNQSPTGGYTSLDHTNTLPVWLQRSGYFTSHIGKYLNGYGSNTVPDTEVPPGWDDWQTSLDDPDAYTGGTYTLYGYTLNENGGVVHYGSTPDVVDPATYQTDVYSAKAEQVIRSRAPSSQPFFLWVTPTAPHGEGQGLCDCAGDNPRAAPRDQGRYAAEPVPRPPSFNEADVSDKPAEIQNITLMNQNQLDALDARYRARLEAVVAIDDMVANVVDTLKQQGELDNTLIVYTSDNGFFHGEHRIRSGKVRHYTESSEVPLVMRGPGVPSGQQRNQLVANIDLAPTILDYARADPGRRSTGARCAPTSRMAASSPAAGC